MAELFDELSRIVASPMPRRQGLRLIGSALVGAVLAPLGFAVADDLPCERPHETCGHGVNSCSGGKCCKSDFTCCGNCCCKNGFTCCGHRCCNGHTQVCVGGTTCRQRPSPHVP